MVCRLEWKIDVTEKTLDKLGFKPSQDKEVEWGVVYENPKFGEVIAVLDGHYEIPNKDEMKSDPVKREAIRRLENCLQTGHRTNGDLGKINPTILEMVSA